MSTAAVTVLVPQKAWTTVVKVCVLFTFVVSPANVKASLERLTEYPSVRSTMLIWSDVLMAMNCPPFIRL